MAPGRPPEPASWGSSERVRGRSSRPSRRRCWPRSGTRCTDAQAAALPTAGLTALRSLEVAGSVLGKRVLVSGATGGVGRIAVQLAHVSGAHVTALVRSAAAVPGADVVVQRIEGDFDVIVDAVGGATFGLAIEHLARRGLVVNLATPEDEPAVTFTAARFDRAAGARIYTLNLFDELAGHATRDLERLLGLVADGRLDPGIDVRGLVARRGDRDRRAARAPRRRQGRARRRLGAL